MSSNASLDERASATRLDESATTDDERPRREAAGKLQSINPANGESIESFDEITDADLERARTADLQ